MSRLVGRIHRAMNEPSMVYYFLKSRFQRDLLFKGYSDLSDSQGISNLKFVLSFDCDTTNDIDVVEEVNRRLNERGIIPVYAVPGELLEKGIETYRHILYTGAEFINHGYRTHSVRKGNHYESTYDYSEIDLFEVEQDIVNGHNTIIKQLGITPKGFRAPHFGNFQKRNQLEYLHKVLISLNYRYSTSTIPYFGFKYGPYFKKFGLAEIPVSGLATEPLRIFDSFLFFNNESGSLNGIEYLKEGLKISKCYQKNVCSGIINIYADPSQIYNCEEFYQIMSEFADFSECMTYSQLVEEIERRHDI